MLLHTKDTQFLSSNIDKKNLNEIRKFFLDIFVLYLDVWIFLAMNMIYKEMLGKSRRYHCPFCARCSSSQSSVVLQHVKVKLFHRFSIRKTDRNRFSFCRMFTLEKIIFSRTVWCLVVIWQKKFFI